MGGSITKHFPFVSTAASLIHSNEDGKYYKQMAQIANLQAEQVLANNKRRSDYIFKSAVQQNNELARNYSTLLGQQKTTLAANGLGANSATTQAILKNSRLNALLDQETLQDNLDATLYENNAAASLEALNFRLRANQYNKVRRTNRLNMITGLINR